MALLSQIRIICQHNTFIRVEPHPLKLAYPLLIQVHQCVALTVALILYIDLVKWVLLRCVAIKSESRLVLSVIEHLGLDLLHLLINHLCGHKDSTAFNRFKYL